MNKKALAMGTTKQPFPPHTSPSQTHALAGENTSAQEPKMLWASRNAGEREIFSPSGDPRRRMVLHATGKGRSPILSPTSPPGWQEGFLPLFYINNQLDLEERSKRKNMGVGTSSSPTSSLDLHSPMWGSGSREGFWEEKYFPGCDSQLQKHPII